MSKRDLEQLVYSLLAELTELKEKVNNLELTCKKQAKYIKELLDENKDLKVKLNSKNSSLPPSSDIGKKPNKDRSLRPKTEKKTGGQSGHKGSNLKKVSNPKNIIDHKVTKCNNCDHDMNNEHQNIKSSRQVFDLPSIKIEVTQHNQYEALCTCCGHHNLADYPLAVNKGQTQYGPNIRALVTYMSIRQYIPMNRIVEFLGTLVGQRISQGTVHNILKVSSQRAKGTYAFIKNQIEQSKVVGADETGCNVKGEKHWAWVFQTPLYTFLKISDSRGYKVIEETFPHGLKNSIVVSDCWAAQLKTPSKGKQICLPHIIRNLNELKDRYQSKWAHQAKTIMIRIMELCKSKRIPLHEKIKIEEEINALLDRPLIGSKKKVRTLLKRLKKYRNHITTCLYHRYVPPDNNGTERAVRNMKVKLKVSGLFRSTEGANNYAILRSLVDTAIKHGLSPFEVIIDPEILIN